MVDTLSLFGEPAAPSIPTQEAFDAYLKAGGELDDRGRRILGRQVKEATYLGITRERIITACSALGRSRAFPGGLLKACKAEPACVNGGARGRLTVAQLRRCSCRDCRAWMELRAREPLPFDKGG